MDRKKGIALAVGAFVVVSGIAFALMFMPAPSDVRIGYLSQDIHQLALRVAIVNGYFEDEGITVELFQYQNGAYEMDGFDGGQIDMGYLGAAPALVKSINQDIAITVLAAANLEGSAISVLKSEYDAGHVTSILDLEGKTVYHPGPATVQNFLLRLALNQSGMTMSDISPEVIRVQDMAISLTSDAPAFIAWEPFPSRAEYENTTVTLLESGDIWPNHPCCVVASTNSFLDSNPANVQKVINAHVRAQNWINNNPVDALAIAVDWLGIDETPVSNAFNRVIFNYNLNVTGLGMYLSFLIEEGQLTNPPSDTSSFLNGFTNQTFVSNAVP